MADSRYRQPQDTFWNRKGKGGGHERRGGASREPHRESHGYATSKIPPYWEPRLEQTGYPFRVWLKDVELRA